MENWSLSIVVALVAAWVHYEYYIPIWAYTHRSEAAQEERLEWTIVVAILVFVLGAFLQEELG